MRRSSSNRGRLGELLAALALAPCPMALLVATWTGAKGAPTRTTPGHLVFSPSGLLPAFLEAVKAAGLSHAPVEDWGPAASMRFQDRKEAIIAILGTVASHGGYRLVSSTGSDQSSEYVWQLQDHALALGSARGTSPVGSAQESRAATPAVEPNLRLSSEHAIQASGAASQAPTPSVTPPPSAVASFVTEERALRGSGTSSGTTGSQRSVAKPAEIEVGPRLTSDASYFHGPISDADAASLLESQPAGAFLARNSSSSPASCIIISCASPLFDLPLVQASFCFAIVAFLSTYAHPCRCVPHSRAPLTCHAPAQVQGRRQDVALPSVEAVDGEVLAREGA